MKKFKVVIATTEIDKQKQRFTEDALRMVAETERKEPLIVLDNFDYTKPLGAVLDLEKNGEVLIATIQLNELEYAHLKDKIFRVHGVLKQSHSEGNIEVIDKFDLFGVSLIDKMRDIYEEKQKMNLSTTEQELYDYINATSGVTVEDIRKDLGPKHVGAIGKLYKIEKVKKEKRRVGEDGYGIKMITYYVTIKEEEKPSNEVKN